MIIPMKYALLRQTDWGCVTKFGDGTFANSTPHHDAHYHVISHRCGYGDDVMRYCVEHDYCHSFLAEHLHDEPSPALWGVAHDAELSGAESTAEEALVQAFQAWLRAAQEPILSGADWHGLRRAALSQLVDAA